jgi:hypothetical protein
MFHAKPGSLAPLLPGYGPTRVLFDGAYSHSFHAASELAVALIWTTALASAVFVVLRRAVATRARHRPRGLAAWPEQPQHAASHEEHER